MRRRLCFLRPQPVRLLLQWPRPLCTGGGAFLLSTTIAGLLLGRETSNVVLSCFRRSNCISGEAALSESPIQGADLHRRRAVALIGLADKTHDLDEAAKMLALAAEQLELAEREITQQQQQAKRAL
jgi:hypothetical protein